MSTKLQPFTKGDFDAFAGVESDSPEIAYVHGIVNEEKASVAVILDGAGVAVELHAWDTDDSGSFMATFPAVEVARDAAESLAARALITTEALREMGFTEIG